MNSLFEAQEVTKEELLRRIEALEAIVMRNEQPGRTAKRLQVPEPLKDAWARWSAYKSTRKGWTEDAKRVNLSKLVSIAKGDAVVAMKVVEQAIEAQWSGLHPLKVDCPLRPVPGVGSVQSQTIRFGAKAALAPSESRLDREIAYARQQAALWDWTEQQLNYAINEARERYG